MEMLIETEMLNEMATEKKAMFARFWEPVIAFMIIVMLATNLMGQIDDSNLNPFRYGDGILIFNSDGESVKGAEIELVDLATKSQVGGKYDTLRASYYFQIAPDKQGPNPCMLRISHPDYEPYIETISCHEAPFSRIVYLGRKGETYYSYAGARIPYRAVPGAIAVCLNPLVKEDKSLANRWEILKKSMGLEVDVDLADSLQKHVAGWNHHFSWKCEFLKVPNGRPLDQEKSTLISSLRKDADIVTFAGPILSRGLSIENSFVFIPNPSKTNQALAIMTQMGIRVEYGAGNQGFGFLEVGAGTGIFDVMNELEASGNFDELSPGITPLYMSA